MAGALAAILGHEVTMGVEAKRGRTDGLWTESRWWEPGAGAEEEGSSCLMGTEAQLRS